jgi:hypothetical protein
MKVAILAFDGLEYDLVERYRLKNIKQRQYDKLSIPKECYTETRDPRGEKVYEPWTPYVWSAFLTGKLPDEVGLSKETLMKWDKSALQLLRTLSMKIGLGSIRNKGRIFEKLGFKRKHFSLEDHQCPTIFNYTETPCIINVPTVSKEWGVQLEGKNFSEMLRVSWQRFYDVKRKTLESVEGGGWDLLMAYTRLLDVVGELCYGNFRKLFRAYNACNEFAGRVKESLNDNDVLCLIISDHGMERFGNTSFGRHSDHAFYSVNVTTSWKPKTILDFFSKIPDWLAK